MNQCDEYYQHEPETWSAAKCAQMAKRRVKDGYGTPFPMGYIPQPHPLGWGRIRYNGGCVKDGKWWKGEEFPVPIVADGFKIEFVMHWGYFIRQKCKNEKQEID